MGLRRLTGKEGRRIITAPSVTDYLRGSDWWRWARLTNPAHCSSSAVNFDFKLEYGGFVRIRVRRGFHRRSHRTPESRMNPPAASSRSSTDNSTLASSGFISSYIRLPCRHSFPIYGARITSSQTPYAQALSGYRYNAPQLRHISNPLGNLLIGSPQV